MAVKSVSQEYEKLSKEIFPQFKIAMLHLNDSFMKEAADSNDIKKVKRLLDIIKGDIKEEDLPSIESTEDLYEAAKTLELGKHDLPKIIMSILQDADTLRLPTGLVGDIGEHLGDKKGIGLIPTSLLQRTFLREELGDKMGSNKWEFFFKDEDKLKKFKDSKGI